MLKVCPSGILSPQFSHFIIKQSEGDKIAVLSNSVWNTPFFKRLERYKPPEPGKLTRSQKDDEIDTVGGAIYWLAFMNVQGYSSSDGFA